jgi:trimeric autotransporter adhesin
LLVTRYLSLVTRGGVSNSGRSVCLLLFCLWLFLVPWCLGGPSPGVEYKGVVTFGGLPVPGATITVTQASKQFVTTSDLQGVYSFPDLTAGKWTLEIQMTGFATLKQEVMISPNSPPGKWELKLLTIDQIKAQIQAAPAPASAPDAGARPGVPAPETVAPGLSPAPPHAHGAENPAGTESAGLKPGATKATKAAKATTKGGKTKGANAESAAVNPGVTNSDTGLAPGSARTAPEEESDQRAADGFLINGSVVNGASSPFAQSFAFGNNRSGGKGLYTGGLAVILDNSALDARPFSLSGQNTPKPAYNRITGVATLGGPLRIPHLLQTHAPNIFAAYQWTRSVNDTTQSALVPSLAERDGDFSQVLNAPGNPVQIFNPSTGLPFAGNVIQPSQISPQAQALLNFYPSPTFSGDPRYNYQTAIVNSIHQDALQSRFNRGFNPKNQIYGGFAFQSTRSATPNLFGFLDTTDLLGINTNANWSHRLSQRMFLTLGYQFSRLATATNPFWENRQNVSANAGITGNNQDPANWGPPTLAFASGFAGLSDAQFAHNRNQTNAASYSLLWNHYRHNVMVGGDFRRQQFNYLSQQNPRGTFTFTGAATAGGTAGGGADFADFLLGIPDTSAIAFGNADKYFRESVYDAYFTDDWRISPQFTLNAGMRWEYGAPITELYGRLVNLDIASGFAAVAPVVALNPLGSLTHSQYPSSLVLPDKHGIEPRVGIGWRPISGSSLLVRAGYGVYDDTSVYQTIARQMAQQAPLSKSLSVANSAACPLTLANGFNACSAITPDTFAIDPHFRVGYAQNWNVSVQRDLPGSLQLVATYLGTKGTRGVQELLPNTFPLGAVNPCPTCPAGFAYLASNGNSTREAGQVQLRRRLHNGLTATLLYTYAKAIDDDAALGGQGAVLPTQTFGSSTSGGGLLGTPGSAVATTGPSNLAIAQNWLNLRAERSLSTFDQRHLLNVQAQYTTGMGLGGKSLMSGWKGTLYKEWTVLTQVAVGSGEPETPVYLTAVQGTGVTGSIRPDATAAPLYVAPSGFFLNPAAYVAPPAGQWGNAGRNTIIGPSEFILNTSMGRTFRLDSRLNLDVRIDSTNFLNHPTFTSWVTTVNSTQFGVPAAANNMRSLQVTVRLRF